MNHRHPQYGTHHGNTPTHVGTCTDSGKRQYTTRKAAKKYLKASVRTFDSTLGAWSPCLCEGCDHWHIGHTPHHKRHDN
jgi:hypothetical protein